MELYASTVIWDGGGKLTVYDKTQGVQNVQRYVCGVFDMKPDDVRVMSPFVGGAFGSGLRPQYQVVLAVLAARALRALGACRADAPADVCARLPARHDPAHRARRKRRRNARRDHARSDHGDVAIRGLPSAGDRLVRPALQVRQREIRAQARAARSSYVVRHARSERCDRRLCARMRDGRTRGRAQARSRSSFACGAIRIATRTPTSHTAARTCANATGRARRRSAGTSATPSRARCATAASWSAGAWRPASGKRCRCRSPCASCSPPTAMRRFPARPPISAPAPTRSWRRSQPTCSACRSKTSPSSSATRRCRNRRSKADHGSRPRWRTGSPRHPTRSARSCCVWRSRCRIRRSPTPSPTRSCLPDGKIVSKRDAFARGADRGRDAAWRRGPHRAGEGHHLRQ